MKVTDAALGLPSGKWLPFTYPPVAALVFAPLAGVSTPTRFLIFEAAGLCLFAAAVMKVSPSGSRTVLVLAAVPVAVLNLRSGQNGLWTAGLAAFAARAWIDGRSTRAGFLAALVTGKPHVAFGVPVAMLVARDWRGLLSCVIVIAALVAASVACFGWAPWAAYPAATHLAWASLQRGLYPMARLNSAYSAAFGLGLRGGMSLVAQLVALLVVGGASLLVARRAGDRRVTAALTIAWGSFVSPYAYDYDLGMLSVSAALLAGPVVARVGVQAAANALVILVVAQFVGLAWFSADRHGGVVFFVAFPLTLTVLRWLGAGQAATAPSLHSASLSSASLSTRTI